MHTLLLIGSTENSGCSRQDLQRRNPLTGDVATVAAAATVEDAVRAADEAAAAFTAWSATGPNFRRTLLNKAADILVARAADFTSAMMEETAATAAWAGFNVGLASRMLREAGAMTTQIKGEVIPSDKPGLLVLGDAPARRVVLGSLPGTRQSSSVCGPLPCRSRAAIPSS